jgi:hypothetical protein
VCPPNATDKCFLASPLDKKQAKQNLDGLNTSKASHIGLAFNSPQEMRPSTEKCFHCSCTLMCPDMSVDVPWYVCWRPLICLLTSPDMSVDVPWYVCWCALICLPTCPYMFANVPWYVVCQRALYVYANVPLYVCQRAPICLPTCTDMLMYADMLMCPDMLICTLMCWRSLIC